MRSIARALAIVVALLAPSAHADVPIVSDAAAVEAYRKGDLATARSEWLALLQGPDAPRAAERARILYDLGNVAFREGKTLEAVGWYTSSRYLRPRDADTWTNLEHARTAAKLEPADRGDLAATLLRLVSSFTPAESEWIAVGGLFLAAVALIGEALRGGRTWRWIAVSGALAALLASGPWAWQLSIRDSDPLLVVEENKALVRSEPGAAAAVVGESSVGSQVERVDELPDWTKIRLDGGLEGWVEKKSVFALRR